MKAEPPVACPHRRCERIDPAGIGMNKWIANEDLRWGLASDERQQKERTRKIRNGAYWQRAAGAMMQHR
jgi:hypothetical protein